jgi:hypothetical protein
MITGCQATNISGRNLEAKLKQGTSSNIFVKIAAQASSKPSERSESTSDRFCP